MKKKIHPKSRILATSQVRSKLYSFLDDMITSEFEDSLANVVSVNIPEYDASWCPADYVASRKEEVALEKAKKAYIEAVVNSLLANAPANVQSSTAICADSEEWTMLSRKSVPDSDGFLTDYALYVNADHSLYICMFGDTDLYEPDVNYADFETESESEAWEWFEDYSGLDGEDDTDFDDPFLIYSSSEPQKYWYFTRHGVMPGSVPKYINILDVVDKPEGSYFLADGIIKTEDLKKFEIKEKAPDDITSATKPSPSFVLRTETWPEMIDALKEHGYLVDSAYRRRPEKWVGLIKKDPDSEEDKYWVVEVTQYFRGDYEVRSDNMHRDRYFE